MTGFVYAITSGDFVKIGWSTDPRRRLGKVSSDNASPCSLIGFIPATLEDEAALHERFASSRVRGEWFRRRPDVEQFISSLTFPVKVAEPKGMQPASDVVARFGGVQAAADACGVTPNAVRRWTYPADQGGTGGFIPSKRQRALLEAARKRGIKLSADDFFAAPRRRA